MKKYLNDFKERKTTLPIYYNLTGEKNTNNIKETIAKHLIRPVQFQKTIENMLNDGIDEFISIGIGITPVNLIRQICKTNGKRIKIKKIESIEDIERILK
jgi:[acyl-carrier-protein] S-malonyltransferase